MSTPCAEALDLSVPGLRFLLNRLRDLAPPLDLADCVCLTALIASSRSLHRLVRPGLVDFRQIAGMDAWAFTVVVQVDPELAATAGFLLHSIAECDGGKARFNEAIGQYFAWLEHEYFAAVERVLAEEGADTASARDRLITRLFLEIRQLSALRPNRQQINSAIRNASAANLGERGRHSDIPATLMSSYSSFIGSQIDGLSSLLVLHPTRGLQLDRRRLRDTIDGLLGRGFANRHGEPLLEDPSNQDSKRRHRCGRARRNGSPLEVPVVSEAEPLSEEVCELRDQLDEHDLLREILDRVENVREGDPTLDWTEAIRRILSALDSHREPALQAALVYEWARACAPRRHAEWTQKRIAVAYRVTRRRLQGRCELARKILASDRAA